MSQAEDITDLLRAHGEGDPQAFERLMPLVYDDLRRIARRQLGSSNPAQTLDPTSLVHEAYLKMVNQSKASWQDRGHFLAISSRAMRQVIITYARRRGAKKRGGGEKRVTLDEGRIAVAEQADWLLSLDQALQRLGAFNERLVRIVECRFFAGLSEEETAQALGISLRTAQRDWKRARAWLKEALRG